MDATPLRGMDRAIGETTFECH